MSVYVDGLVAGSVSLLRGKWRFGESCQMYADTAAELHELAGLVGLSRSWFQDDPGFPHYDLTPHKRQQAIARGAVPVDRRHAADFRRRRRAAGNARGETAGAMETGHDASDQPA